MKKTLFISDLHLDAARPESTAAFLKLLETEARDADALYILGDFFEAWVGDTELPFVQSLFAGMRALHQHGVPIYLMHGNRDFLMSQRFAKMASCTLIADPTVIDLYGVKTLLCHGDSLCTHDKVYQRLRPLLRSWFFRMLITSLPLSYRYRIGKKARNKSMKENQKKSYEIMDVAQDAVEANLRQHRARLLIHGHTHQPAIHHFYLNSQSIQRIVLSDWYVKPNLLICNEQHEYRLISF